MKRDYRHRKDVKSDNQYRKEVKIPKVLKVNRTKLDLVLSQSDFDELIKIIPFAFSGEIWVATVKVVAGEYGFCGHEVYDVVLTIEPSALEGSVHIVDLEFPQEKYTADEMLSFFVRLKDLVIKYKGELLLDINDGKINSVQLYRDGNRLNVRKVNVYVEGEFVETATHVVNEAFKKTDEVNHNDREIVVGIAKEAFKRMVC